jgi:hypothetical protein
VNRSTLFDALTVLIAIAASVGAVALMTHVLNSLALQ